ncbi:FAR1-related sequence 5-like protein [Tanacetum coccineum]
MNVIEVTKLIDLNKQVFEDNNEFESDTENVIPEVANPNAVIEELTKCMKTPRATLYEHNETPGRSIYWESHVQGIPIPVEGIYYDTVDEAIDMYTKYAKIGGFEVKKSGQRLTKLGAVKHKYIMCNKEGVPKGRNSELVAMFWADEVAKCNYKEFGDIISFEATFNNNKYNMKFVTFIGVDNHENCVTLGSGMLLHEDTKSYTWLLKSFMIAFLKERTMIVTDQDGAMKRAIEAIFTKAKQRLCMWHIMQKIPLKSQMDLQMFNLREFWIPASFVWTHHYMGLTMTTTRSESENTSQKFHEAQGNLVSFMMSYESAMERQRYRQEALDFKTIDVAPKYLKINEGCETVIIRDKKPNDNRSLNTKKGKEQEKKTGTMAEGVRDYKKMVRCKDEGRMGTFVEKLKKLLDEVKADMPNPPSRNTGDVIGCIFSISKPNQVDVKNSIKAINKGEHLKKGERLKSEREKALKVRAKKMKVCGYCNQKTNEHTKTTCPLNPKASKKRKATPIIDV